MALPIEVEAEQACKLNPKKVVGKHILIRGEVGLVQSFDKISMPGGGHSYHNILFEHHDAAVRVLLRRRKMGSWNPGQPFAILKDPPAHTGLQGSPTPVGDAEARLWMQAHHFQLDNPRQEGKASWSDDDPPLFVTPLAEACYQGRVDIAQWLVTSGGAEADLEEPPDHSRTCMHFAAFGGQLEAMKWLCGKGKREQIYSIDQCGQTTCHFAAMCEVEGLGLECLKFLKMQGCGQELWKPDGDGDTVMHTAILHGNVDICEWLLSSLSASAARNALHVKNNHGQSAVEMALEERDVEVCEWLLSLTKTPCTEEQKKELRTVIRHG